MGMLDYKKYRDNFPSNYYVEFGKYIAEKSIEWHFKLFNDKYETSKIIDMSLHSLCLFLNSKNEMWNHGGLAIFHVYENYVAKYDNDKNGLDKVLHFLYSSLYCFVKGAPNSLIIGYAVEIIDFAKQKLGGDGSGFDVSDIKANKDGIEYGNELRARYYRIVY